MLAQTWRDRQGVTSTKPLVTEEHPFTVTWRHHLLTVANEASGECEIDAMLEVIDYRWPRRRGSKRSSVLRTLSQEAEVLGILNGGGLSSAGRRLAAASDSAALAKAVTAHLAAEVDTVLIQADHTIVAAGPLTPAVGRPLRDLADVESRGHGCVLRISNASLRRALTVDADPQAWIEFLRSISSKNVPQPVIYAITDAARSLPGVRSDFVAPCPPAPRRRPRTRATAATVDKTLRVLRAEELRERVDEAPIDISEVPRMDSSTVVASVKYAIDHNETVHLTHAESDGVHRRSSGRPHSPRWRISHGLRPPRRTGAHPRRLSNLRRRGDSDQRLNPQELVNSSTATAIDRRFSGIGTTPIPGPVGTASRPSRSTKGSVTSSA